MCRLDILDRPSWERELTSELMYFQCMVKYRRENAKHLFAQLMKEGVCRLDILDRPRWGCELTPKTIPISIGDL